MSETETKINTAKVFMGKTYSMSLEQIEQIKAMAQELTNREGKSVSDAEVIRRAVRSFHAVVFSK